MAWRCGINLYALGDEKVKSCFPWPYVYLHGYAEDYNGSVIQERMDNSDGMEFAAYDCFCADKPMPEHSCELVGNLYGIPVVIVLRKLDGRNWIQGRAVWMFEESEVAFNHAWDVENWR